MKKAEFSDQVDFFRRKITDHNCIIEIVSSDDRNNSTIDALKKNVKSAMTKGGLNNKSAITLIRILTYYQALNEGIKPMLSIMFKSGHVWNVEYTASERSDRTEGLEARLSRNRSDKNYIVVGEYGKLRSRKRPIVDPRNNVSVVSMEEFVDDLLYEIFSYEKNGKKKIPISKSPMAQINGSRGGFWEECIAECMRQQGVFMPVLYKQIITLIMKDEGFAEVDIKTIGANCVGTKGKKTDVAIEIELNSGRRIKKNISAKASGRDAVSIHQAKASDFVKKLGITDKKVEDALIIFQKYGNASGMTATEEKILKDYFAKPVEYQKLLDWCFLGPSGKVDYILIHSYERDDNKVSGHTKIYGIKDYMSQVKKMARSEGFGTGLAWTYKTVKTRGKKRNEIQLKVPLIY